MYKTIDNEEIQNCEIEYTKCFSKAVEKQDFIRFIDDLLKDMYYHNFTLIKNSNSDDELFRRIEDEILLRKTEGENFCNIVSFVSLSDYLRQKFENKPEISVNGFYLFDTDKLSQLRGKNDCTISKVSNEKMIDDVLRLDLEHDGDSLGVDFCTRRVYRRKDVYLSAEGVNSYVCYADNKAVGSCDLFINKKVGKIDDFSVSPTKQRQGYGTAILKFIIETALSSGASNIYLVTDEDDTAKEMYQKNGFCKIGETTDLLFKI